MDDSRDLLQLAALLEQAYRLALDVQDDVPSMAPNSRQAAVELVDVLDAARVSLLQASRPAASSGSAVARPLNERQIIGPIG